MTELVPAPPATLGRLKLTTMVWPATKPLHQVYALQRGACAFNPGHGAGRFHPIFDGKGKATPTIYLADSVEGATMETVFRAASAAAPSHVPRKLVDTYGYATVRLVRSVNLLPLWGHNLRRLGVVRAQLLEPGPAYYTATARWAEALHRALPAVKGLAWYSRQFDGAVSMMFFGDRLRRRDFKIVKDWGGFAGADAYALIADIANRANIVITES